MSRSLELTRRRPQGGRMGIRYRLGLPVGPIAVIASLAIGVLTYGPTTAVASQTQTRAVCRFATPGAVESVLGVSEKYISQPIRIGTTGCAWHSTNPNCYTRTLSIRVVRDRQTITELDRISANTKETARAVSFGDRSFFQSEQLPPGAAIMIDQLFVRRKRYWVTFSLAGRLGPYGSRDLLELVADSVRAA